MKIIFLDIDGVLNTYYTFKKLREERKISKRIALEEDKIVLLKEIVDNTDAKIVLCSEWRMYIRKRRNKLYPVEKEVKELFTLFEKYNLELYDFTPKYVDLKRQEEIYGWLKKHNVDDFIIIDNLYEELEYFKEHLIATNFGTINDNENELGLCPHHVTEAINMLNTKKKVLK